MSDAPEYYDPGRLISRNATLNLAIGGRGIGKTYGYKKYVLKRFLGRGEEFIYARRYKGELTAAKNSFLADMPQELAGRMRVRGSQCQYCLTPELPPKKQEWAPAGYFVALSTAGNQKSVAYPKVRTIIYDEFILPPGGSMRYLPDEPRMFLEFYSTVDRGADRVKAFLLANSASIMCPYMAAWGVMPDGGREFVDAMKGYVCAQYIKPGKYGEWVAQTRFGKFIRRIDSEYADYAIGNVFHDGHDIFVEKPGPDMSYLATILGGQAPLVLWRRDTEKWWATTRRPKQEKIFCHAPESMTPGARLITKNDWPVAPARWAYARGKVTFHNAAARNTFTTLY